MNQYITGAIIKNLREKKHLTQEQLAGRLNVSDKAVSKWETGKSYPDIALLESIASELGVSVAELLSGQEIINKNRSANMVRSRLYVCPVCGNAVHSTGDVSLSCCGIALPVLEPEKAEGEHEMMLSRVEDEVCVTVKHEMTREHYISFLAYAGPDRFDMVKLYPEGEALARFKVRGGGVFYGYCNRDGLFVCKAVI